MARVSPRISSCVLSVLVIMGGCATGPAVREHLTAVVLAESDERAVLEAALRDSGAEAEIDVVTLVEPSPLVTPDAGAVSDGVAHARANYEDGEYETCVAALSDPALLTLALEVGDRETAARLLWWQAACARAASGPEAARVALDALAILDLPRPAADAEAVSASLEVQLADVRAELAARGRGTLVLELELDARLAIDGAPVPCASHCRVSLALGRHHVRVQADGRVTESRWASVGEENPPITVTLDDASPERAAAEWQAHYAPSDVESSASLSLLRRALRSERLVLVVSETLEASVRVRGHFSDGVTERHAERLGATAPDRDVALSLLYELVPWARPEPWWETPWPWIVLGALLAGAAAGITYYYAAPIEGASLVRVGVMP